MSMGYGAYANLVHFDDDLIMYSYCCYNVNNENYNIFEKMEDGELYIDRDALVEPEIREKIKKMPSGRRKQIGKRIKKNVSVEELFYMGKIKVKNASGTWKTTDFGIDIMALRILYKIFDEYQETGVIPKNVVWYS